jgi:hypothetical protein
LGIIHFLSGMQSAIQFDKDPAFEACEIDDVRSDWHLPSEPAVLNLAPPQSLPNALFGSSKISPEVAGEL